MVILSIPYRKFKMSLAMPETLADLKEIRLVVIFSSVLRILTITN